MLRAIIIDDELRSCQTLEKLIVDFCGNVEVLALCQTVNAGIEAISRNKPDLVFLDVNMKGESGFDLLSKIQPIDFEIIFATAYSEYSIKAFKFSAIDFLLKPIDIDDLKRAIEKVEQRKNSDIAVRIEQLITNLKPTSPKQYKLAIPSSDGLVFVKISDIIYCEASGNYTIFFIADGRKYLVGRTLKEYEDMLTDQDFFRIHNSHLINLNAIKKYIRGEGGQVIMLNDATLDVSKRKKEPFLKKIPH